MLCGDKLLCIALVAACILSTGKAAEANNVEDREWPVPFSIEQAETGPEAPWSDDMWEWYGDHRPEVRGDEGHGNYNWVYQ